MRKDLKKMRDLTIWIFEGRVITEEVVADAKALR